MLGSSLQLTSAVTTASPGVISKVLSSARSGTIATPGKYRNRKSQIMCQIDSFKADQIKRIIQKSYADNKPPLASDIHKTFMDQVKTEEELLRTTGKAVVPFTCHEKTFRKILHTLGFKYGRINTRDVLLMRPQIVTWRGKYLSEMRKNRNSPEPMEIVWLDGREHFRHSYTDTHIHLVITDSMILKPTETWIDTNARTGKAWIMKNPKDYRERSLYSFQKNKVARGPRIIVLNAGKSDASSYCQLFHSP